MVSKSEVVIFQMNSQRLLTASTPEEGQKKHLALLLLMAPFPGPFGTRAGRQ